jgi:hypothetical protein
MESLDSQARRRLVDMFIGGSFSGHSCRTSLEGETITVDYAYTGFQNTQLVMPYAGIRQSSQYVFVQRPDVGFRYDCLGRTESDINIMEAFGNEIDAIWPDAPVIFEFCGYLDDGFLAPAHALLQSTHATLVHDNLEDDAYPGQQSIATLIRYVGYRYYLAEVTYPSSIEANQELDLQMVWQNLGYAPSYPKMGQIFHLNLYLVDQSGTTVADFELNEDLAQWMPADPLGDPPPQYPLEVKLPVPDLQAGTYQLKLAIVDERTHQPIHLAMVGQDDEGYFLLGLLTIE